jgi:predicted Zn-dependent protease
MKRWAPLIVVIALLLAGLAISQLRKPQAEVGPDSVLHFIGDTERELSRLPLSATRLSDAEEIRIGNELAQRYKHYESSKDESEETTLFRRYIERVGSVVASRSNRKLPYRFHYIPESYMVNAFAIPGGHVYVGRGLLDLMDSEDELASILGHEIEHIDRYHPIDRLQVQSRLQHLGIFRLIVSVPFELFQAGYSKEQELEADREGTRLAVESGYSATGALRMFEAFDRRFREARQQQAKSPQEEAARVVLATMEGYFRSHPATNDREAQIRSLMETQGWQAKSERPFELSYLLWTDRAENALRAHRYKEASGMASQALREHPDYPRALQVRADADYFQANFRGAADTYRELLKQQVDAETINTFADLMATSDREHAVSLFQNWIKESGKASNQEVTDALAGLLLLTNEPAAAEKLTAELRSNPGATNAPERMARLGWWYYRAAQYPHAYELLDAAAQQRPTSRAILFQFAMSAIEIRRLEQAITLLQSAGVQAPTTAAYDGRKTPGEHEHFTNVSMANAIAHWLTLDRDRALQEFQAALDREPSWADAKWVEPQYSATVVRAISEMKSEAERRKKASELNVRQAQ